MYKDTNPVEYIRADDGRATQRGPQERTNRRSMMVGQWRSVTPAIDCQRRTQHWCSSFRSKAAVSVFLASVSATMQVLRRKLLILLFPSTNCSKSTFADSELRVTATGRTGLCRVNPWSLMGTYWCRRRIRADPGPPATRRRRTQAMAPTPCLCTFTIVPMLLALQ
jgi:hypothetical protein